MVDILFCVALGIIIVSIVAITVDELITNHKVKNWIIKDSDVK